MSKRKPVETLPLIERIKKHVVEEGDCWLWTGATQANSPTPVLNYKGRPISVRLAILRDKGVDMTGLLATFSCECNLCVNPAHVIPATRQQVQERSAKMLGYHLDPARRAKLSEAARRGHGKLTQDKVEQIRMAEGTQAEIAARFGVSQSTVGRVRRSMGYFCMGSPWSGLGARR